MAVAVNVYGKEAELKPCVVIPVFDNEATVGDVVTRALALAMPVIVVDDGCRDRSAERARAAGALVISHEKNRGKGAALATAFREALARGLTHAVTVDADGQLFPEDVPALLEVARAAPDALVIGARDFEGQEHVQRKSSFGRAFSNFWVLFETGVHVSDTQCGLRVYPLAHVVQLPLRSERFDFEVEVIVRSSWAGLPVLSVPVRVHYPPPRERISHFHVLRDNARITLLNARLVARRFVPWPHRKLVRTPRKTLRERLRALAHESDSPQALGVAFAVGVITGASPFYFFQTLLALSLAALFRLNKIATVVGSIIMSPPVYFPVIGASIEVGSLIVDGHFRPWPQLSELSTWTFLKGVFVEALVGTLFVAVPLAAVLGALVAVFVHWRRSRRGAA